MVTNVVQSHYTYYDYHIVDHDLEGSGMRRRKRRARMLFRLQARTGLNVARSFNEGSKGIVKINGVSTDLSKLHFEFKSGSILWIENAPEFAEKVFEGLKGGLLLADKDLAILFNRPEMAPTRYDVRL